MSAFDYQRGPNYPDGSPIPRSLPPRYQFSGNPGVPFPQKCSNCEYYNPQNNRCSFWNNAVVKPDYWCSHWKTNIKD